MTIDLVGRVHRRAIDEVSGAITADAVRHVALAEDPLLSGSRLEGLVARVLSLTEGLGPLDLLLADPTINEIMVNGPGPVWIERHGLVTMSTVTVDRDLLGSVVERVVGPLGLRVDRTSPLLDARLPDGSRVNVAVPPVAIDGPYLTIRRFSSRPIGLQEFGPPEVVSVLAAAVDEKRNIVISGGTGAGKTTLLNALAAHVPPGERIVTVEDAAELKLPQPHVVRLEARPANAEGAGAVRVRDLVRNALRMRPDRIVVGECRGGEAFDMLQAMNTGHEGSMSTCHANSPLDARRRLETMVLMGDVDLPPSAVRDQVTASVDLIVQVARRDGSRSVVAVDEVDEAGTTPLMNGVECRRPSRPPRRSP